jgi:predicted membrane protein
MSNENPLASTPKLAFGVLILIFGAILLADSLKFVDDDVVLPYFWPLAGFLLAGAFAVARTWWLAVICTLFGGLTAARLLGLRIEYEFDFFDLFWPMILICVGVHLVRRTLSGAKAKVGPSDEADSGTTVENFAFMAGNVVRNSSQSFRGGDASAFMGGVEIDLTSARMPPDGAVLDVFAMWGAVEIRVPHGWQVESKVVPLLGAFEDKTTPPADPGAVTGKLTVRGFVIMGGIEVSHGNASRNW